MGDTVFMWTVLTGIARATISNIRSTSLEIVVNVPCRDGGDRDLSIDSWIVPSMSSIGISGSKIWFPQALAKVSLCSLCIQKMLF